MFPVRFHKISYSTQAILFGLFICPVLSLFFGLGSRLSNGFHVDDTMLVG